MQLLSSRILQVQQLAFPDAVAAVQLARLLQRLLHKLLIIHVHGSLKKESRRVSIALRSTVFQKTVVVSTTEGQLPLDSLSCLGELGIISPIHAANGLLATNLQHHLVQPGQRDGLVILRERLTACAALISPSEPIECNPMLHLFIFHVHNNIKKKLTPKAPSSRRKPLQKKAPPEGARKERRREPKKGAAEGSRRRSKEAPSEPPFQAFPTPGPLPQAPRQKQAPSFFTPGSSPRTSPRAPSNDAPGHG